MFELTKYLSRRAAEEHFFIIIIVFNKAQIWWHLHYSCSILQHLRRSASRLERVIDHKRCDTLLLKEVSSSRSLLSSANEVTRCLPELQNVFSKDSLHKNLPREQNWMEQYLYWYQVHISHYPKTLTHVWCVIIININIINQWKRYLSRYQSVDHWHAACC